MKFFTTQTIGGVTLPRRRFTGWAALYFVLFVCVPFLGLALLLDVIFYLIFTRVFDSCYGVLCLFS
ncbi:MAG: hypothetical protein HOM58_14005 [Rhodospirillaceae bacterium]|jgi:hypothetical protein|nr:hypothetical protein [Rhodospirillaceae bacterium]MBT5455942.1 hypothetical protein [Rhodospirillaceae bacterium]